MSDRLFRNDQAVMSNDAGRAPAYELAYTEGVRALDEQRVVIDAFRTRAGLLLSAAAIATSFLGGAALDGGTSVLTWLAITAFVLLGVGVILILWPRGDWEYTARPRRIIETYIEPDSLGLPLIHRDLAYHMDASYLRNRGHLHDLVRLFRVSSILLVLEIVAWVVDLIVTG
jgi:hypothetical protein